MLELTLQRALKPMQVYINEESEWITDQVHIKAIILEDSQVDVWCPQFNQVWRHTRRCLITQKNSRIDWISKELYIMVDVYEILKQPEMSLSEHKSWDHKIPLLNDKQPKWMPLYSMSEDQLKKVRTYLDENLKRDSSDHQSHWQNTQSCLYQRRMTQSNYVSTTDNSTR
jgi:hypothetical protein